MAQTTEECLDFLKEAKEVLEDIQTLKADEDNKAEKEQQLERSYEAEKKRRNDTIQQTIKKRRDEIRTSYDRELAKAQEQLKKTRAKREKARSQGIKERIADETEGYHNDILSVRTQIKNCAHQKHLPFICRSQMYYSLYFPRHFKEILVFLLFVLIFFAAFPCGVYLLIPKRRPLWLAVIYIVDLLIVGGIYIFIGNHTKLLYMEALRECRGYFDQIYELKKNICRTTRSIRRDRNEEHYNLGKFDDEISRLQKELDDVAAGKKEALNTYENVTKNILTDEIESSFQTQLEELEQEHAQAEMDLQVVREELKKKRLDAAENYSSHLGKEFMDPAKVAKLCLIVQEGHASSVTEAIEWYKENE